MAKFQTPYTYAHESETPFISHEYNDGQSITEPNQSMTIPQLMQRHQKGEILHQSFEPTWYGDTYIPEPKSMDMVEFKQYADKIKLDLIEKEKIVKDLEKRRDDAKKAMEEEKEKQLLAKLASMRVEDGE